MNKMTRRIVFTFTIIVCIAAAVLVVYYMMTKGKLGQGSEENATEVERLLSKDLETKYPETPTEVVKLYWRFNKCLYNSSFSDKNYKAMLEQLRKLYDDELLGEDKNSLEQMMDRLDSEREKYAKADKTIANYVVQPNSTVQYGTLDKRESATVISGTLTKAKSKREQIYEKFLCRKDDSGKWKILGWESTDSKEDIAMLGDN